MYLDGVEEYNFFFIFIGKKMTYKIPTNNILGKLTKYDNLSKRETMNVFNYILITPWRWTTQRKYQMACYLVNADLWRKPLYINSKPNASQCIMTESSVNPFPLLNFLKWVCLPSILFWNCPLSSLEILIWQFEVVQSRTYSI